MNKRIIVAITGASGAAYSQKLLHCLAAQRLEIHLVMSPYGRRLLSDELNIHDPRPDVLVAPELAGCIEIHPYKDVGDVLASGSFLSSGMVICPCSSHTLAEVAAGLGGNLISRAAAVHLKEKRKLILVHREMPSSQIDLENMLRISRAGGTICPAAPGFYMLPKKVDDLIDFVAGKICDLLDVPHGLNTRWQPKDSTVEADVR